jgi:hypothetical protein
VAPPSARRKTLWELGLVDADSDVDALACAAVLDPQGLGRNPRERVRLRRLPVPKGRLRSGRLERGHELGAKADVDELAGHVSTLIPRLR